MRRTRSGYFEQAVADMNRWGVEPVIVLGPVHPAYRAAMGGAAYDRLNDAVHAVPRRASTAGSGSPSPTSAIWPRSVAPTASSTTASTCTWRTCGRCSPGRCRRPALLFNSREFLFAFLPVALLGWWWLRDRNLRLAFLALMSYVFYAYWDWRFVGLMWLSTGIDYVAARMIVSRHGSRAGPRST